MTFLYSGPRRPAPQPTQCPCLTCAAYGPYCADTCVQFEAWEAAGKPGAVLAVQAAQTEDRP
jgi:hypothetical protein